MSELQASLQRLSNTTLDAQGAANDWAGTTGLDIVGALNAKAGTTGLELNGVCRDLARQFGGNPNLDAAGALASLVAGGYGESGISGFDDPGIPFSGDFGFSEALEGSFDGDIGFDAPILAFDHT